MACNKSNSSMPVDSTTLPPSPQVQLIALILVLLIAIGAGYYLHTTGELDKLQKHVKKIMQGR